MRLFKFKGARDIEHALDIIMLDRLYCAEYRHLNDPFEGQYRQLTLNAPLRIPVMAVHGRRAPAVPSGTSFSTAFATSLGTPSVSGGVQGRPVMAPVTNPAAPNNFGTPALFEANWSDVSQLEEEEPRICSLSSAMTDVRMWSLYASGHTGFAVEIELDESWGPLYAVTYEQWLPMFSQPVNAIAVLTKKTFHWQYESEYRVIATQAFVPISGAVRAVHMGPRTSEAHELLLRRVVPRTIPIYRSRLDLTTIQVVQGDVALNP